MPFMRDYALVIVKAAVAVGAASLIGAGLTAAPASAGPLFTAGEKSARGVCQLAATELRGHQLHDSRVHAGDDELPAGRWLRDLRRDPEEIELRHVTQRLSNE
jgi:hypothetical protein